MKLTFPKRLSSVPTRTIARRPWGLSRNQRYDEGCRMLEAFHWRERARLATAVALELKFSAFVEGTEVTGFAD